ncbi:MAG: DUF2088 domain-containing protein [Desulfobacteraceae bacterium]|nr:DUF2088 domain-containing protein [Desulfobacteraceae bacterium]MBC2757338.1 DUF2088 domain-containing protein [Desulfobacteraceae bacterium]MBC2763948.1 DUF2088 domain-containing protein [ANME-2 cluster archaeon]
MNKHFPFIFPEMAIVRQKFFKSGISHIPEDIRTSFDRIPDQFQSNNGKTVAVAVGSRNIDNLHIVVDQCLRFLEQKGFKPFIVPAMGSHGGATAIGQKAVLEKYRITEETMKVPIVADMETQCIATHPSGLNIYVSKAALSADHLVIINRIKPHTKFKADIESGLCKMMTIGLGKDQGASEFHRYAVDHTFGIIEEAAEILLKKLNVLFGVGLLEDGYGKLAHIEAIFPDQLIDREKILLENAFNMMGSIPFDFLDILIVDHFGKDISGIGMDSNITGRHRDIVGDIKIAPNVKRIFVRDLSPGSDGNANGIGLADFTTSRLVERLDIEKTYVNAITAISPEKAAIPIYFDSDRKCLDACARTTGVANYNDLRVVRIKDTASLKHLQVSRSLESEVLENPDMSLVSPWHKVTFNESGNLPEFFSDE